MCVSSRCQSDPSGSHVGDALSSRRRGGTYPLSPIPPIRLRVANSVALFVRLSGELWLVLRGIYICGEGKQRWNFDEFVPPHVRHRT